MLLFDDSKKLEKALGEDAAAVLAHVFEKADENWKRELASKADLMEVKAGLTADLMKVKADLTADLMEVRSDIQNIRETMVTKAELAATENRILRWVFGGFITQTALIVAIMAFLR
jgi:hypothetical protein